MSHRYLESEIGNLKYAYSLKKLDSSYNGNCIEVRRSSDDTTTNIGFNGDELDSSALTTFLNGSNGSVVTWYDQTGTVNLTQSTNANQPRIIQEDNEWTIRFDGSSANMRLENASALTTATNSALHVIWKAPSDYPTDLADDLAGIQFGSAAQQFKPWHDSGNGPALFTSGGDEIQTSGVWDDGNWRNHIVTFNNGTTTPYEMGSEIFDPTTRTNPDMAHLYLGGNGTDVANMYVSELVWFDAVVVPKQIWFISKSNYQTNFFTYTDLFLHIGDSITSGTRAGNGNEWTYQLHSSRGSDRWHTKGYSGYQIANWNNAIDELLFYGNSQNITVPGARCAIVFCGTNDMAGGNDGATTFSRLKTLCQSLKAGRFGLVGVITALPRSAANAGVNFETYRTAFNQAIRDDTSDDFDFYIDTDTNSNLTDETNTTYFTPDEIHLNATGAGEIASMVETALSGITLSNFILPEVEVGINFAVRGDSLNARYSSAGATPGALGGANEPVVNSTQAGINGSTSIDMAGGFLTFRSLAYIGRESTPSDRPRSVLMRVKFASLSTTMGLMQMGGFARIPVNYIALAVNSTPEVNVRVANNLGQADTGTTTSSGLGTTNWHDIVVTWDGTNGASGLNVYVDGTVRLTDTMTRSLPTPYDDNERQSCDRIIIGAADAYSQNAHYYVDEFVVWDTVIDPTSINLTSGTGSLNGNSRSAYVDVESFDGAASSGSGTNILGFNNFGF